MRFITTLLLFVSVTVFAQSKTGTIDIDFIVTKMPAFKEVQTSLETYGNTLDEDFKAKLKSYDSLLKSYKNEEAGLTLLQKQEKQKELLELERDIENFKNNGIQLIQIRRDEKMRPLYTEIGAALETVAKEQAYTLIMETNDSMVYIDPSTDVTNLVLQKLGITVTE